MLENFAMVNKTWTIRIDKTEECITYSLMLPLLNKIRYPKS